MIKVKDALQKSAIAEKGSKLLLSNKVSIGRL